MFPAPFPKIPLRCVLVVPFLIQIVGSVSLVGYFADRSGQESLRMMADRLVSETDARVRDHLDDYLQEAFHATQVNDRAVREGNLDITDRARLQESFWQQINLSPGLSAINFTNAQGEEITYVRLDNRVFVAQVRRLTGENLSLNTLIYGEVTSATPGVRKYYLVNDRGQPRKLLYQFNIDNRTTPWFRYGQEMDRLGWSPVYPLRILPTLAIAAIIPVRNEKGEWLGLFNSTRQLSDMGAFLEKLDFSPSGLVFIVDRTGNLIATSTGEIPFIERKNAPAQRLAAIDSEDQRTRSIARQIIEKYGSFAQIPNGTILNLDVNQQRQFTRVDAYRNQNGLDWVTVVTIPESDFMAGIEANRRKTLILCGLTLVVATGLGLLTARAIVKPIQELNEESQILAGGQWQPRSRPEIAIDELESLTRSFERMAWQLKESLDRTRIALNESEDKFAKIFRVSPDAISIVSLETGAYMAVNDRFISLTGYRREEIIGRTATELGLSAINGQNSQELPEPNFCDREWQFLTQAGEYRVGSLSGETIELDGHPCLLTVFRDYSDRQRAESILKEAQRVAHIGSWEFDLAPQTMFWSEELYRIHGIDPLQPPPDSETLLTTIIHPDDRPLNEEFMARLSCGETAETDLRIVRADGSLRYISARGEPILDPDGKPIRFVGTVLDITERKQIELELKEKENRFQSLAAALPGVLYTVVEGLNGPQRFEYVNPIFEEIIEIPIREALIDATPVFEAIIPEDRANYLRAVKESLETMKPFRHEWRIITASGKLKWLQANSQPEYRENGEVVWHGFVQDITERKHLELALQASEARLKDILDNANVILSGLRVFRDGRWIIDRVSAASEQISGFTAEELTVDNYLWVSRINSEDWQRLIPGLMDSIFAGRPITNEYRLNHRDGSQRWISQATNSRYDGAQDCWIVTNVASDISERHATERVKDEFISVVSHELRTPLTSLKGALGLLSAGVLGKQPEMAGEMLAIATRNCDRLVQLVNDILDLERLESGRVKLRLESCSVADLMTRAVDLMTILALNAGITLDCCSLKVTASVDPEAIGKTLTNLLGNAIKFSPAGSTVRLQARVIHGKPDRDFSTPCILFSVEDHGRGIPQDKLQSIFGRFQQVDISDARHPGGTGLGLAICKTLVTQHGGKIWAESVLGEGSTFYFTIPISQKLTLDKG